ncbi:hypothetical protein [Mediterraneibacter gnavus]|jgi:hypothetical protein|uniref:Uncharacterized protein n=1 Tax=Mediterraneibacter gnavus TaxID=33038 RepID=A0A414UY65_MEDGN|nr:hypothetical protein [Mediterraneibacter gnavus]RGQ59512.1 hypothetical protein DWY88_16700 [Mediterraneibacter gnavus]RHG65715.1 hypothetical protein DW248_17925 [Mediterraneibacter gnavus]RHG87348.1 hypothetical protein DW243_04385 [Mediterraneibacter gnavus]
MKRNKEILWGLTFLAVLSGIYCCDLQVWGGFEYFIHKSALLTNIGYSVIASYIFYWVQNVIPTYINERSALRKVKESLKKIYENMVEISGIINCSIVENEGVITLKSGELNVMKIVGNQEKKYRKIEIGDVFSEYKGKIQENIKEIKESNFYQQLDDITYGIIADIEEMKICDYMDDLAKIFETGVIVKRESIQEQLERCDYNIKKMKRNLKISYEIKIACEENVPEQLEHLLEISKKEKSWLSWNFEDKQRIM